MDNNPPNPVPQPQQPVVPQQPVTNVVQESPKGNKMLWIIVGLVVVILVVGGVYWYMGQQKGASTKTKASPKPTATTQSVDALEKDLNSTSLDDLDKEFSSVDTDLQGL